MGVIDRSRMPWKPRSNSYSRSKTGLESKWSCPLFSYKRQRSPFWCSVVMVTAALTGPVYLCVLVHFSSLGLCAYSCLCASPFKLTWSSFLGGDFRQDDLTGVDPSSGRLCWMASSAWLQWPPFFQPQPKPLQFSLKREKDKLSILPDISDTPNS